MQCGLMVGVQPIYECQCLECGEKFEKLERSMDSPPEMKCSKCGGRRVKKLPSAFGIQTSGSASQPVCPTCEPRR